MLYRVLGKNENRQHETLLNNLTTRITMDKKRR